MIRLRAAAAVTVAAGTIVSAVAGGSALAAGSSPTKAQAIAYAKKVNLRASDLKGFKEGKSKKETPAEKRIGQDFARCAGAAGLKKNQVAEVESPDFEHQNASAQSDVTVVRSAGDAAKELKLVQQSRTTSCMRTALHKLLKQPMPGGVTFVSSKLEQSHPTVPGSDGAFEFDMELVGEVHHKKVPVFLSLIGFVHGSAEIGLTLESALEPIPGEAADALLTLLDKRALAAKL